MIDDTVHLVVDKYNGSLKAEHGTGRNIAPYVRYEWGDKAYKAMQDTKQLFDPKNLLNRDVIFNEDPKGHLKNLKSLTPTNDKVDKCIECGFCEVSCLTAGFSLSHSCFPRPCMRSLSPPRQCKIFPGTVQSWAVKLKHICVTEIKWDIYGSKASLEARTPNEKFGLFS